MTRKIWKIIPFILACCFLVISCGSTPTPSEKDHSLIITSHALSQGCPEQTKDQMILHADGTYTLTPNHVGFVKDLSLDTPQDLHPKVPPKHLETKKLQVCNNGTVSLSLATVIKLWEPEHPANPNKGIQTPISIDLDRKNIKTPATLSVGEIAEVDIPFSTPQQLGKYTELMELCDVQGNCFPDALSMSFEVAA